MLEKIKENYKYFKTLIFGSRLSLKIYNLHLLYNFIFFIFNIFKKYSVKDEILNENLNNFRNQGYVKIDNLISKNLLNNIYVKYSNFIIDENFLSKKSAQNISRLNNCLVNIPDIKKILDQKNIKNFLLNYFKGNYKIYYCDAHRLFNTNNHSNKVQNSSLEWHFDNLPKNLIKLMVYLVDVNKENAAISLLDKKLSTKLKFKGYWNRKSELSKNLINKYNVDSQSKYIEGEYGSSVFFSTHYCLHRANKPTGYNKFRDAIIFLIGPSLGKFNFETDIEKDKILSNSEEIKLNPFLI